MMGRKSFAMRLLSWVHSFLIFEGIYVLAAGLGHIRGWDAVCFFARGLWLFVPLVLTDIAVRRCKSLAVFILSAAVLTGCMRIFAGAFPAGGLTAFICLYRCYGKLKQGEIKRKMRQMPGEAAVKDDAEIWETPNLLDSPKAVHGIVPVFIYLALLPVRRHELSGLTLFLLAAQLCVCFLYTYLECFWEFINKNRNVANLPVRAMKKTGAWIMGAGILLLVLFMLPAAVYHKEPLENLKFDISENADFHVGEIRREEPEPDLMMEELMRIKASARKTPPWVMAASKIVSILLLLWLAFMTLRMIFSALKTAAAKFSDDWEDEVIFIRKPGESPGGRMEKAKKKETWRSPDRRIRRLYKRAVKRRLKAGVLGSETPLELEQKAGFQKELKACDIHELYEKARYAQAECTKEEVKQCVHIFSNFDR